MLLVGLENALLSPKDDLPLRAASDSKSNIEHVLPQNWQQWPPEPGLPEEVSDAYRKAYVHMLGNLTLVTGRLNSALSNRSWEQKRPELDMHSAFALTRQTILNPPPTASSEHDWANPWSPADITQRGEYLLEVALHAGLARLRHCQPTDAAGPEHTKKNLERSTPEADPDRFAKSREFADAAREGLALADEADRVANSFVALAVLSGIACADVICGRRIGRYYSGQNHREAIDLLRKADPVAAKALKALLDLKTTAE